MGRIDVRQTLKTLAVLNQKGGVGKTTTVVNIAAALARMGQKVIAIDMDPQAHLTIHLGVNPETAGEGVYDVLVKGAKVSDLLQEVRPNLFLLASSIDLVGAESELVSVVGREIILREALAEIEDDYDYLIIDCAPSLGLLTLNGLSAVEDVLIPLQPHFLALQGFGKLLQTVDLVSKRINPDVKVSYVLFCMFDKRATLSSEVKADIEKFLQTGRGTGYPWAEAKIIPTFVRRNIRLAEAPSYGQTIFEFEADCHGAEDYIKVAEYISGITAPPAEKSAETAAETAPAEQTAEVAEEPVVEAPVAEEPVTDAPVAGEPVARAPIPIEPVETKPAADESAGVKRIITEWRRD